MINVSDKLIRDYLHHTAHTNFYFALREESLGERFPKPSEYSKYLVDCFEIVLEWDDLNSDIEQFRFDVLASDGHRIKIWHADRVMLEKTDIDLAVIDMSDADHAARRIVWTVPKSGITHLANVVQSKLSAYIQYAHTIGIKLDAYSARVIATVLMTEKAEGATQ